MGSEQTSAGHAPGKGVAAVAAAAVDGATAAAEPGLDPTAWMVPVFTLAGAPRST